MKENLIDTSSPLSIEKWSYKVFQKGRKIKKWLWESLAGIVFLIIAFLAVLQWTFMHHSDDILGVILKEIVVIKSKERYRLTYDSIRLDFLRGKMYVDNARVIPDFAKMPTSKTIFHIEVPKIELKIASLWRAYFQKEIKLYDIRFKQPFVEVFSNTIQKDSSHEIKIDNLYYLIENYARKLEVNHFIINGGKFILRNHDNNQEPILIQNIHVEVNGFVINQQTNSPQRPFDAERIKLRISQNSIPLEKGKKLLYIGDLNIETDAQQITIRNLTLDSLGEGSNFSFKIPLIEFHKVDFKKLHFEKKLKIEELFIDNPRIIIKNQKNNSQKKDISINPYELFSKYLHEININKIFLKKGFFSTDISSKNSSIHIEQPNIDISAFNLKIDSISQNERSKKFYIDDIELKISTIRQKINGNYISARKLFVSTKKSHIIVENLYLKTADNQKEVNLERFFLENFNLWNFIHKKELIASKITLEKPLFKLLNNEKQEIPHQTESIEKVLHDIYPQTSKLAKKIFVKEISIENGQIHIQKEKQTILVIDSLNTLLTHLNISKRKFDRKKPLFFADNLVLNSKKLYVFFPKSSYHFTANNIELNILEKKLKANELIYKIADSLQGKTNIDKLYEINSKQVVIEGFKINEILLDSIICLNKFKIQNPSFIITNKNVQTKYLEEPTKRFDIFDIKKIQINSFLTENAQIQVRNQNNSPHLTFKDFNLIVNHLGFDSLEWKKRKSKLLYKDAKLYGYELSYFLPDSIHKIDIAFTSYNSLKKLFYLKNISISNNQITKENANIYLENRFSSIHLKGINLLDLQDNNILIDTLLLRQDFSKVLVLNNATESNNKTNFLENIQKIIQKTPFQLKLNYLNGQLKNNEIYTKAGSYGKIGNLIIELNQFSLDSLQNSKDLFFNKQNKFFINNITYYDKKNELSSEKIYFSFTEDSIHVEKLSIKPRIKNIHHCFFEENNRSSFFIDKLFVSKIGAYKFLSNNTIDVQEIRLENPHIEVYSKSKKTSSTFSLDSTFALIKSKFKEAKIGYLIVKDVILSLNRLDVLDSNLLVPKVKLYTNKFYHLNLDISKWNIEDSTSFLKSKDVLFTSYKFMFPLPDSLNYLKSEKITLNIAKNQILLDSLELLPRYSKAEYALKSGKALDRFHLKTSSILLDNFDFKKLLLKKELNIGKVAVHGLNLEVYGDKTIPEIPRQKYLLPTMLKNIPYDLNIDTVLLYKGRITYEEYTGDYEQKTTYDSLSIRNEGYILLQNINAIISGITNINTDKTDKKVVLQGQLQIMEKGGQAFIEIVIPLSNKDEEHTVKAVVTQMSLKELNPILEKLAFIRIKDGYLKGLDFSFKANQRYAEGRMKMRYDNLKVAILNSKKLKGSSYKEDKFLSFFANNLFIRPKNPKNFFLKKGRIYHERDIHKSMVNFWVKSILSGVISSISPKKQKPSKLIKQEMTQKKKILRIELRKNKSEIEIEED